VAEIEGQGLCEPKRFERSASLRSWLGQRVVLGAIPDEDDPEERPNETDARERNKRYAPAVAQGEPSRYRTSQPAAYRCACVCESNGGCNLTRGKPVADHLIGSGTKRCFSEAEYYSEYKQRCEACSYSCQTAKCRPHRHRESEHALGPDGIGCIAAHKGKQRITSEEAAEDDTELCRVQPEIAHDERSRYGQGRPVHVVDHSAGK
jgi:hypothetical protein